MDKVEKVEGVQSDPVEPTQKEREEEGTSRPDGHTDGAGEGYTKTRNRRPWLVNSTNKSVEQWGKEGFLVLWGIRRREMVPKDDGSNWLWIEFDRTEGSDKIDCVLDLGVVPILFSEPEDAQQWHATARDEFGLDVIIVPVICPAQGEEE